MSNEEEKIANENLKRIRPQSPCKRFKGKPLGKNEYWSPNLVMSKKIETMDCDYVAMILETKIVNLLLVSFFS